MYLGITAPRFPNYFTIAVSRCHKLKGCGIANKLFKGPGSTWSNGSLIPGIETSIEYIIKLMKKIQKEGVLSITVKQDATDHLYQHFDEIHKRTVWQEECRSWYKNGKLKNRIYLWPGPVSSPISSIGDD